MAISKLTDAKIKTLKPQEKTYKILDSDRLYIEVRPHGAKLWRYRFVFNGKESMMGFGEYPAVTLADARQKRDEAKSLLAKGINPVEFKRQQKAEQAEENRDTFTKIANEFIRERLADKSPGHVNSFKRALEKDILAIIGNKDIRDISSADVLKVMQNTIKRVKKQSNHGSGEVTAIANRKVIGAVMRYAIATLRAENDPTYAVRDAVIRPEVEHARPLTKEERKALRQKIDTYRGSTTVKNAILAMFYSMLRTVEIRRMKWEYVDFEEMTITFPASKKGGSRVTKKNRIHIVPLTRQLHDLLKEQYKESANKDYVFPSVYKTGMMSATTVNRALDYIGLHDVTAHDFRATASTLLHEKGYESDWIELQLSHDDDDKTRASYNHARYLDDRRKMLQDWADIIDSWKE